LVQAGLNTEHVYIRFLVGISNIFTEVLGGFPQFFQPVARIINYNITVFFQIFVIYYSVKVMVNFTLEKP
jgi:hypothetical protein